MDEWFVRWTMKLATQVRSRVVVGLPTGYSVLGGNLTEYCYQQYQPQTWGNCNSNCNVIVKNYIFKAMESNL